MQLIANGTFGLTVALGLLAIGVPYAILWGFLGFTLRYIPYIGPWIAALLPVLLSLAMFEGWMQPLLVIGLFLVIELISNNVIEPRLYGHSIGVSTVALLIAAPFWTFLWGPVGLVLSSPMTVCLVVLGKYVPQLTFFDVLLGNEPPLDAHVTFYQRLLLARDQADRPALVCIGALPPGGLAHTRYLCKKLRARFPKVKIERGKGHRRSHPLGVRVDQQAIPSDGRRDG